MVPRQKSAGRLSGTRWYYRLCALCVPYLSHFAEAPPYRVPAQLTSLLHSYLSHTCRCVGYSGVATEAVSDQLVAPATPFRCDTSPKLMKLTSLLFCCTSRTPIYSEEVPASAPKASHEASASPPVINDAVKPKPAKTTKPPAESEPYSSARATELFSKYAEADDSSVIGPEGFERLCKDAEIPLEGALPLVLAWQLGASEMAKITKEEWDKGTAELQYVSSSRSLLLLP